MTVFGVLLFATLIRSAFGFGEALVAVPLLAFAMPARTAVPVAVFASVVVAAIVVVQDWEKIHLRSAGALIFSTLFGIPVGLWVLKQVPEAVVEGILGALVALFAVYSLAGRGRTGHWGDDRLAWIFGFLAGVLGGAYGINGPPLVIYGALRGWKPVQFRATLQAYFLPAGLVGIAGYALTGLWTAEVTHHAIYSFPAILVSAFAGREINRRIHPERFIVVVNVGLLGIGLLLLWRSYHA